MSKRAEIAPCPFCGGDADAYEIAKPSPPANQSPYLLEVETWNIYCDCGYRSGIQWTESEAIAAHNSIARRLDPAKLLMVIGGVKGSMSWPCDKPQYLSEIEILDEIMDKIRAMAKDAK